MASSQPPPAGLVNQDTLVNIKVAIDGTNRRFKLALRDLGAHILPQKVIIPMTPLPPFPSAQAA